MGEEGRVKPKWSEIETREKENKEMEKKTKERDRKRELGGHALRN